MNLENLGCVARAKGGRILGGGLATLALVAMAGAAQAEGSGQPDFQQVADAPMAEIPVAAATDDSLTRYGVTFYGTIDIGVAYQTHGAGFNRDFSAGLEYLLQKNSNKANFTMAPNGMSQSKVGLKGDEELADGYSAVFKLETNFDPLSMHLSDSLKSMVSNNGRALNDQNSNGDSSKAGQFFSGAAYAGIKSISYGTLTYGRQNGLLADGIVAYDPQGASNAFAVIGYSGVAAGVGDTQDLRLDNSIRYSHQIGPFRAGLQYQFAGRQYDLGSAAGMDGGAAEVDFGGDYGNFSGDVIYSQKKDAISASPLSAAQTLTLPTNSLAATVSDNSAISAMAKYQIGPAKIYGGYERIRFANPDDPLPKGVTDLGGYDLGTLTQNAYNTNRILQIYWTGLKYSVTDKLDLTGAYYGYAQNNYSGLASCSTTLKSSCSGNLNAVSFSAVYTINKHFNVYGGAMISQVQNGLASGYLHDHTVDPMVGGRFTF